ncbi:MAG: hypothetical protein ACLSVD_00480 [Eggerthellaceae bacterium]
MVLDEATAFTDPENEERIQQSIARLTRSKTCWSSRTACPPWRRPTTSRWWITGASSRTARTTGCLPPARSTRPCGRLTCARRRGLPFPKGGPRCKALKRIIAWTGPYRRNLYLGCVCSFFMTWATAAP